MSGEDDLRFRLQRLRAQAYADAAERTKDLSERQRLMEKSRRIEEESDWAVGIGDQVDDRHP